MREVGVDSRTEQGSRGHLHLTPKKDLKELRADGRHIRKVAADEEASRRR